MKTRLLATAALGAALGVSMPAEAEGLYVGAFGGVSILEDSDLSVDNAGLSYDVEVDSDTGWALGGALGYAFDFGLRTEAELAYRRNDLDKFHVTNPLPSTVSVDGDTTALSILGNVWYDIPVSFALRPYVGAGIGMASVGVNDAESAVADVIDDSDWVLLCALGRLGCDGGVPLFPNGGRHARPGGPARRRGVRIPRPQCGPGRALQLSVIAA
jgi:outer membrane protein W